MAATNLKHGITLHQAISKITGLESQSGRLLNMLSLPANLENDARTAANTRNYLTHGFLRNLAPALQDEARCEEAAKELAVVDGKLNEIEARLEAYICDLGIPELSEEELASWDWGDHGLSSCSTTNEICALRHRRPTVPDDVPLPTTRALPPPVAYPGARPRCNPSVAAPHSRAFPLQRPIRLLDDQAVSSAGPVVGLAPVFSSRTQRAPSPCAVDNDSPATPLLG